MPPARPVPRPAVIPPGRPAVVPAPLPPLVARPPRFPIRVPWGGMLVDVFGGLGNLPFAFNPLFPNGGSNVGVCASPRPEITSTVLRWGNAVCATSGIVSAANSCVDGQAGPGGSDYNGSFNQVWRSGQYRTTSGLVRYQILEAHCYPSAAPRMAPQIAPAGNPWPVPISLPSAVRDQLLGRGWPQGYERAYEGPMNRPSYTPGISFTVYEGVDGRNRIDVRHRPNPRPNPRPDPKPKPEKERKNRAQRIAAFFLSMLSSFSEARDMIQSVHRGVPPRLRGARSPADTIGQMNDIIDHWDDIDWATAGIAVAENELEDRLYGWAFGRANRAGQFNGIDIERQLGMLDSYAHEDTAMDYFYDRAPGR